MICHLCACSNKETTEELPPGWKKALVTFTHTDDFEDKRIEVIHPDGETRYQDEPMHTTAQKCALLVLGIPFYFIAYVALHLARIPLVAIATIFVSIREVPKSIAMNIWAIVRAPFYLIAMEFAAIYGVFKPEARVLIGNYEAALHKGKTRRDDINHYKETNLLRALVEKDFPYTLFLAYCMQPLGKLTDPNIKSWDHQ
ncbi:MAG TPA: hypothetical protein VLE89_00140 [Chlamydiales bacterium]|nr:hypothetical protein [Chlamydiales bacterium]